MLFGTDPHDPAHSYYYKVDDFAGAGDAARDARVVLFFCTHAHADHLAGLRDDPPWERGRVVASTETARMLIRRFPSLGKRLLAFDIDPEAGHEIALDAAQTRSVTVTLIDANHCPGSAMMLVQGPFGNRLHTGDFRFDPALHLPENCGCLSHVHEVYMDTTFLHPSWSIPTKSESTALLVELLRQLDVARGRKVFLAVDMLGQEDILTAVHHALGSTLGSIVLPLNACNQSKMNRNAMLVWNDWLDTPALHGIVKRAEKCLKCSVCTQGWGGAGQTCATRSRGKLRKRSREEGNAASESKEWRRDEESFEYEAPAISACTFWRRKLNRQERKEYKLSRAAAKGRQKDERQGQREQDGHTEQADIGQADCIDAAHDMDGQREPDLNEKQRLMIFDRLRALNGYAGNADASSSYRGQGPAGGHAGKKKKAENVAQDRLQMEKDSKRRRDPRSTWINDLRRYFQHHGRSNDALFIRCSTLAFSTEEETVLEADGNAREKPLPATFVRGCPNNIRYCGGGTWRVLYSMHSSYPELQAFYDAIRRKSPSARFFHALPGQPQHDQPISEHAFQRPPLLPFVHECALPIEQQVRDATERAELWLAAEHAAQMRDAAHTASDPGPSGRCCGRCSPQMQARASPPNPPKHEIMRIVSAALPRVS